MLPTLDRDKLAKLLARLESDQDGEVLVAARKVAALLREAGVGWDDLLSAGPKGWTQAFDLSTQYFLELKRRVSAERAAEHWQRLARTREDELRRLKAAGATAPGATGHAVIDRLLGAELDPRRRARVEAIATWYRRTGEITRAEEADLDTFARQVGPASA